MIVLVFHILVCGEFTPFRTPHPHPTSLSSLTTPDPKLLKLHIITTIHHAHFDKRSIPLFPISLVLGFSKRFPPHYWSSEGELKHFQVAAILWLWQVCDKPWWYIQDLNSSLSLFCFLPNHPSTPTPTRAPWCPVVGG